MSLPSTGDFVEVRGRPWLVESVEDKGEGLKALKLACVSDDAQGEPLEVAWGAEIGPQLIAEDTWETLGRNGTDNAATFAAYLRTLTWNTATAADRDLFQAPFRAGIRLDAYQLLPLRKALRLPRVNLLIADDVGLFGRADRPAAGGDRGDRGPAHLGRLRHRAATAAVRPA